MTNIQLASRLEALKKVVQVRATKPVAPVHRFTTESPPTSRPSQSSLFQGRPPFIRRRQLALQLGESCALSARSRCLSRL